MSIVKALSLLQPYEIDPPKIRIGPNGDGGYVLADILNTNQDVLSYGVADEYCFEEEMARQGHRVFMFDHTIDGVATASGGMRWWKEGVGGADRPEKSLYTMDSHIARYGVNPQDLILKMDVEGAEFDAFKAVDPGNLAQFSQMVIEFHHLRSLSNPRFLRKFVEVFEKINRHFTLFHVHGNNYDGPAPQVADGAPVSNLIELSYIRTDLVRRRPSETVYPTALDYPNTDQPEKLLWFFPFLPQSADIAALEKSFARNRGEADPGRAPSDGTAAPGAGAQQDQTPLK